MYNMTIFFKMKSEETKKMFTAAKISKNRFWYTNESNFFQAFVKRFFTVEISYTNTYTEKSKLDLHIITLHLHRIICTLHLSYKHIKKVFVIQISIYRFEWNKNENIYPSQLTKHIHDNCIANVIFYAYHKWVHFHTCISRAQHCSSYRLDSKI